MSFADVKPGSTMGLGTPMEGDLRFDTTLMRLQVYHGGAWINTTPDPAAKPELDPRLPDGVDDDDRLSWDAINGKWTTAINELGSQSNIKTLTDGEVLVYDDANNEWYSEEAVLTKDTHTIIGGTPANPSGVI